MTDVLELLKRADPVDADRLRTQAPPSDALDAILKSPRERVPRTRPRILIPAAGLALAAALAVATLAGGGARPDDAAAAALRQFAGVARSRPAAHELGPGEYLYTRVNAVPVLAMGPDRPFHREIHSPSDYGFSVQVLQTTETWQGSNGGLVRSTVAGPRFPSARDRRAWIDAGRPQLPGGDTFEDKIGGGIERLSLPRDPDELLKELQHRAADGDHGNAYIFSELIADNLREPGTTPAQRAALYEVAARLPGIELLGPRMDREGRRGTGFASDDDEGRHRMALIIDPHTGELLARRSVALPGNPIPAGTVVEDSTYSAPVVVGGIGERP